MDSETLGVGYQVTCIWPRDSYALVVKTSELKAFTVTNYVLVEPLYSFTLRDIRNLRSSFPERHLEILQRAGLFI